MLRDIVEFLKDADLKLLDEDRALVASIVSPSATRKPFFDLHLTFLDAKCWVLRVSLLLCHYSLLPVFEKLKLVAHQMLMKVFDSLPCGCQVLIGSLVELITSCDPLCPEDEVRID